MTAVALDSDSGFCAIVERSGRPPAIRVVEEFLWFSIQRARGKRVARRAEILCLENHNPSRDFPIKIRQTEALGDSFPDRRVDTSSLWVLLESETVVSEAGSSRASSSAGTRHDVVAPLGRHEFWRDILTPERIEAQLDQHSRSPLLMELSDKGERAYLIS